jgi:hypothetical protein
LKFTAIAIRRARREFRFDRGFGAGQPPAVHCRKDNSYEAG